MASTHRAPSMLWQRLVSRAQACHLSHRGFTSSLCVLPRHKLGAESSMGLRGVTSGLPPLGLGACRSFSSSSRSDDPYKILGIGRNATPEEIKKAYKKEAMKWHPDRQPPEKREEAQKRFTEVANAYETLSDPEKRRASDAGGGANGFTGHTGFHSTGGNTQASAEDLFRQVFGQRGFQELFLNLQAMQGFGSPGISVGATVKVHTDKRRLLRLCRAAGIDATNDGKRVQSVGKEGRVIKVDHDDDTAKVAVNGVGDVWFPAQALDMTGAGMGMENFMPFASPFVNTPLHGGGTSKEVWHVEVKQPLPLERWRTHPQEATAAISKLSKQGSIDEAMEAVHHMVQNHVQANTFHYNAVLSGCKREGRWTFALGLLSEMSRSILHPSIVTFNSVISACAESSAWQVALDVLQMVSTDHILPTAVTFNAAISACARGRESGTALSLLSMMKSHSIQQDQISFGTAIAALEGESWQHAIHLLGCMTKALITPDVVTYSSAIAVCGSKSQWLQGLHILSHMFESQILPNQVTYGAAISACERGHEWQHALNLLSSMRGQKHNPNKIVSSAAISACEKASNWQAALSVSVGMTAAQLQLDIISCNPVIAACANGGQWQLALYLFAQMQTTASLCPDCFSYTAAVSACSRTSQWQRALLLWEDMTRAGVEASSVSWNAMISSCEKGGQWELALCALETMMGECPPQETTFGAAISACARGSRWQSAIMLLACCKEQQMQPSVISYSAAISACEDVAEWQPALQLLHTMLRDTTTPNIVTYSSVISACERGLQWQLALDIFWDMTKQKLTPDAVTCSSAISACEQGGLWHVAVRLLADIRVFTAMPTDGSTAAAISACRRQSRWQMVSSLLLDTSTPAGAVTNSLLLDDLTAVAGCTDLSSADVSYISWRLARATRHFPPGMMEQASGQLAKLVAAAPTDLEFSELCSVMWSVASMSAADVLSGLVDRATVQLEHGDGRLLKSASLANLAWALSTSGPSKTHDSALLQVQSELVRRLPELCQSQSYRWQMEFVDAALTILWASSFADVLAWATADAARSSLSQLGARLDLDSLKLLPVASGQSGQVPSAPSSAAPFVKAEVADVLVVFKPPGWEVDLGPQEASREKGRLSEFVLSMYPRCHSSLLSDVSKQHGFLHRLDVPCSGLLLVATTHKAYFDLHFQLATAALIRDYVVVTRGWMSPQRREIQAPVHWWDSAAL
ncbi:EMB2654, partial [Symbiodinium natans]